jgi:hypothetical protein
MAWLETAKQERLFLHDAAGFAPRPPRHSLALPGRVLYSQDIDEPVAAVIVDFSLPPCPASFSRCATRLATFPEAVGPLCTTLTASSISSPPPDRIFGESIRAVVRGLLVWVVR